jgi:hypothetical protein
MEIIDLSAYHTDNTGNNSWTIATPFPTSEQVGTIQKEITIGKSAIKIPYGP